MKKVLFILLICFTALSCGSDSSVTVSKEIPIEVAKLAQNKQFDTLSVVITKTDLYVYEKGEYKNTISLGSNVGAGIAVGIIICLLLMLFIGLITNGYD